MKVNLNDVIEAIEFANDTTTYYYYKKTGVIIYTDDYGSVDDPEMMEDLEDNPEDYIELPDSYEINEGKMMVNFLCDYYDVDEVFGKRIRVLKRMIEDKGLLDEWDKYKEDKEKEIAVRWCEVNDIEYYLP